jgi:hypothetical protein
VEPPLEFPVIPPAVAAVLFVWALLVAAGAVWQYRDGPDRAADYEDES